MRLLRNRIGKGAKLAVQAGLADRPRSRSYPAAIAAVAGILVVSAAANVLLARRAERRNPPVGRFVEVNGVRLHYLDRGQGGPVVLLHGNGSMIEEFTTSGLVNLLAQHHRVIVFDRPGYGHSTRPRGRIFTAEAQAELIHAALERIGISHAIVLGHSWGALVAVALALKHPQAVRGLVLESGYYYPTLRADVALFSGPAVPVLGDLMRYTISPIAARLIWPLLMRRIFGPAPVPPKFRSFPREMAVRPSHLRASAAESALMIPMAWANSARYAGLAMPVAIVAGDGDRQVRTDAQSVRLHRVLGHSTFRRVARAGHMVHQTAPQEVLAAIEEVAAAATQLPFTKALGEGGNPRP